MWETHELGEHLREVARRTTEGSARFASPEWGYLAGLWHDLGKYQPEFQKYIRSVSGFDAHIETATGRVKRAIAGFIHAVFCILQLPADLFELRRSCAPFVDPKKMGLEVFSMSNGGLSGGPPPWDTVIHDPIPCMYPRIISIENMNERTEHHMLFHAHSANANVD
ncbi:MAG: CRISPR-associated endonuclease Cas3'' [Pseudomonadota bacterium]